MSSLSTHVLDSVAGAPASGVRVVLDQLSGAWSTIGTGVTDGDGRVSEWGTTVPLAPGTYRLTFDVGPWFAARGTETFYPEVAVTFRVDDERHHHVPLLLAPYAYSTYRGS